MNYYFNTQFYTSKETLQHESAGLTKNFTMDITTLISIGITNGRGRDYTAISSEFDVDRAWKDDYIRKSVLRDIYEEYRRTSNNPDINNLSWIWSLETMIKIIRLVGKPNHKIVREIQAYLLDSELDLDGETMVTLGSKWEAVIHFQGVENEIRDDALSDVKSNGYYTHQSWMNFYQLFGGFFKLPAGMRKYTIDLRSSLTDRPDEPKSTSTLDKAKWCSDLHTTIKKPMIMSDIKFKIKKDGDITRSVSLSKVVVAYKKGFKVICGNTTIKLKTRLGKKQFMYALSKATNYKSVKDLVVEFYIDHPEENTHVDYEQFAGHILKLDDKIQKLSKGKIKKLTKYTKNEMV